MHKDPEPTISVVIPTLNSECTLEACIRSILEQDYPRQNVEIIIADGGSTDSTLEIAKKFEARIYHNPLRTGEAGKAVGVEHSKNEVVALIDSDNLLPVKDWFRKMVYPLKDSSIIASEPLYFSYRPEDYPVTRYCALIGMNDPLCLFLGNYDRLSVLTRRWTDLRVKYVDRGPYLAVELDPQNMPTVGANGFLIRADILKKTHYRPYLFDVDIMYELSIGGLNKMAKTNVGIIHLYAKDLREFRKKQERRIHDYINYSRHGLRKYPWAKMKTVKILKFSLYTLSTVPLMVQAMRGYREKPDNAWWLHVSACWITLIVYSKGWLSQTRWYLTNALGVHSSFFQNSAQGNVSQSNEVIHK